MNTDHCHTCELVIRRDTGDAPLWDRIYRTQYWDAAHAFNVALPGWLVLVSRRHIAAVDEMSQAEAIELGILLRDVSIALKQVVGCEKTYVMQFAESADHPHVHFHIVPRMADQPEDKKGPKIFGYMGSGEIQVSDEVMNGLAAAIQPILASLFSDTNPADFLTRGS